MPMYHDLPKDLSDRLVLRLSSQATLTDLALPEAVTDQLHAITNRLILLRHRRRHHDGPPYMAGVQGNCVLFVGTSGTDNALAAHTLANQLGQSLWQVDLAAVVSIFVGETEKNLDRLFQDAEANDAVLLFDEADSLFGKRSEVKDAHDRYVDMDVDYLLQKIEEHDGTVFLTSHQVYDPDTPCARHMSEIVHVPCPHNGTALT